MPYQELVGVGVPAQRPMLFIQVDLSRCPIWESNMDRIRSKWASYYWITGIFVFLFVLESVRHFLACEYVEYISPYYTSKFRFQAGAPRQEPYRVESTAIIISPWQTRNSSKDKNGLPYASLDARMNLKKYVAETRQRLPACLRVIKVPPTSWPSVVGGVGNGGGEIFIHLASLPLRHSFLPVIVFPCQVILGHLLITTWRTLDLVD